LSQLVRLLIIFGAIWLAVWLLKRALSGGGRGADSEAAKSSLPRMVPCSYCGVHVPESDAVLHAGKFYCCDDHRAQGEAKG